MRTRSVTDDRNHVAERHDDSAAGPGVRVVTAALIPVVSVASAAVAVLAGLVSRMAWRPGDVAVPGGLVLAVAASVSVVLAARVHSRGLGFVAAGSWIVVTGLVLGGRPEGDYVFAQDGFGLGYLVVAAVAVVSAAAAGGAP